MDELTNTTYTLFALLLKASDSVLSNHTTYYYMQSSLRNGGADGYLVISSHSYFFFFLSHTSHNQILFILSTTTHVPHFRSSAVNMSYLNPFRTRDPSPEYVGCVLAATPANMVTRGLEVLSWDSFSDLAKRRHCL